MLRSAAFVIGCALLAVAALTLFAASPGFVTGASPAPHQHNLSPCVVTHTKTASPSVVLLGEEITVSLSVRAACPDPPGPLHIVLALDGSGSMQGSHTREMKQSVARFIRDLDMPNNPSTKVGVVEFNQQARRLCSLTNNGNQSIGCVNRVGANGGSRIDLGILEGLRVISQGRSGINRSELTEVLIVLTDGENDAGCDPVLSAARQARGQGVLVIAVCLGEGCDEHCLRQVPSAPRWYYRAEDADQLPTVFQHILDQLRRIQLRSLTVVDTLPDWMEYVPDSASPPQTAPVDPDRWLRWEDFYVPADGVTYSFKVKPFKSGSVPTNVEATGELTDNKGRSKSWLFDVPWVTVLGPAPPATSTPTATRPPPTATATPTPTATPRPVPVFLPITRRE